jgi:1,2-diacylglycerol 3-alpha-glucosyltransferase
MKIVQVTNRYAASLGGIETHVERLSSGLAGRGHEIEVLTHKLRGTDVGVEQLGGVTVHRFARSIWMTHANFSVRLAAAMRAINDADVVHVHGYHDTSAAIAAALCRIPIVFTPRFHGTSASRFRAVLHRPYRMVGRWIVRRSATPTVLPPGGVHLLAAGRLEDYKHVDKTIMSLIHLDEVYQLHISGDGPQRVTLEQLVAELGLAQRVHFRGRRNRRRCIRYPRSRRSCKSPSRCRPSLSDALQFRRSRRRDQECEPPGGSPPD